MQICVRLGDSGKVFFRLFWLTIVFKCFGFILYQEYKKTVGCAFVVGGKFLITIITKAKGSSFLHLSLVKAFNGEFIGRGFGLLGIGTCVGLRAVGDNV